MRERYPTVMKLSLLCLVLVVGSSSVFAQAVPPGVPSDKPVTYDGKRNPKEDKSRLRELSGVVRDESGSPIDGAVVRMKDTKSGRVIDYITKQDGAYEFHELSMDIDYELTAQRKGFDDAAKKLSKYDSRKPATLNFELARSKKAS